METEIKSKDEKKRKIEPEAHLDGPPGKKRKLNEDNRTNQITVNTNIPSVPLPTTSSQIPVQPQPKKVEKPKPARSPLELMVFQGPKIPKKKITEVKHKYPTRRRKRKRRVNMKKKKMLLNGSQPNLLDRPRQKLDKVRTVKMFISWVTWCLIKKYINSGNDVLSFGCEKGDHLHKYHTSNVRSWTGVEPQQGRLHEVRRRYNKKLEWNFEPTLICFELGKADFMSSITELKTIRKKFDVICSFGNNLQQFFSDEGSLSTYMRNVTTPLKKGGKFICIVKDGYVVKKKLDVSPTKKFGTELYEFEFEKKEFTKKDGPYSLKYTFHFKIDDDNDNEESTIVPPPPPPTTSTTSQQNNSNIESSEQQQQQIVPPPPPTPPKKTNNKKKKEKGVENLVHPAFLKSVTRKFGMDILEESNFHDFITRYREEYKDLFSRYLRTNSVQPSDWDALYLYRVFVFEKRGVEVEDQFFKDKRSRYVTHHHFIAENEILNLKKNVEMEM